MDRAPPMLDTLHTLELRVFDGPQNGASAPLAVGSSCLLAASPDGHYASVDIALREDQLPPASVRISAELQHALIEVLDGEVLLGNQVLSAGKRAVWQMHAPMRIGRSTVAFGQAGDDSWKPEPIAVEQIGASTGTSKNASVGAHPDRLATANEADRQPSADAGKREREPIRRRAEVWLATTGAALLLACGGAMWMAHVAAAPQAVQAKGAAPIGEALKASEFAMLDTIERQDGRVEVRGRLATQAQRTRLDAWLTAHEFTPAIEVSIDEVLVRDVTEVFRVNGVSVQARVVAPGRIVAEAAERNVEQLARAEDVVRRDVRALDKLTVKNTVVPLPAPVTPMSDDPGKRIASVVPGDPAYIVTVDGARYFVGALLPSGHRITQVAAQKVTLERDGRETNLNF